MNTQEQDRPRPAPVILLVAMTSATPAKGNPSLGLGKDVETYIANVPEPAQTALRQLREIIRVAVPKGAIEVISYGIPAFAFPKPFFGYGAFKNHLSVLPFSGAILDSFAEELKPYFRTKSSLHLPFDKPLPAKLIHKLVRARLASMGDPGSR